MNFIIEILFRPIEFVICWLFDVGCSIATWVGESLAKLLKMIFRIKEE
jgi:hypothetical protein